MAWCDSCDRYFVNEYALQQHLDNAEVHRTPFCEPCGQSFSSWEGLSQHEDNSLKHKRNVYDYVCSPCNWGCDDEWEWERHEVEVHFWCKVHDRYFNNENNLRQHLASAAHRGNKLLCPSCERGFPTYSAVARHMESGTCEGGLNRRNVEMYIRQKDRGHLVTNKLLTYGETWQPEPDVWATDNAWNGRAYECYFCDNEYSSLGKLNGHITRFHAQTRVHSVYHCPSKECGKQYKLFGDLMGHLEHSNTCTGRNVLKRSILPAARMLTYKC
ncbi:hypothetical protein BDZ91DRAFT_668417 [Kalaharituber pfeilii]|nr:hypothetical protein BDZ91DRAFT_668417 [Kalaharituber pfeilii]